MNDECEKLKAINKKLVDILEDVANFVADCIDRSVLDGYGRNVTFDPDEARALLDSIDDATHNSTEETP